MKFFAVITVALVSLLSSSCQTRGSGDGIAKQVDDTQGVYAYLASGRNMNVLNSGGAGFGEFGAIYSLIKSNSRRSYFRTEPISIRAFRRAPNTNLEAIVLEHRTGYQVQQKLAGEITASIGAKISEYGVDASAFRKRLIDSNIRFKVSKVAVYEDELSNIFTPSEIAKLKVPATASALITPLEVLIISDFEYERGEDITNEGKLVVNYIKSIEADLEAKRNIVFSGGITYEDARVIAITPHVLKVRE